MSHDRVMLPILVDDLEPTQAQIEPKSQRSYQKNPETAKFRFADSAGTVQRRPTGTAINGWQLRNRFLSWPIEDWHRFFEISGEWNVSPVGRDFTRDDFAEWQRLLRAALVSRAKDWEALTNEFDWNKVVQMRLPMPITFEWDGKVPVVHIGIRHNALRLMIATIQVDKLRGAEFRVCARPDCKNPPFAVGVRRKIYCDSDCAHLVAVREARKRAANKAGRK